MRTPNIQLQRLYRKRAQAAAVRARQTDANGNRKKTIAHRSDADRWWRIYSEYGGGSDDADLSNSR